MPIDKQKLDVIWYENDEGEKWLPPMDGNQYQPPKGYIFQHTQFPGLLIHRVVMSLEDGEQTTFSRKLKQWPEDLVLAMAVSKNWTLGEAILIAANSCPRCLNVLASEYGMIWGYPIYSEEWHKSGSVCDFCKNEKEESLIALVK